MKKIILLIAMVFLLISCSNNNYVQKGFSQNEKQALILFKDKIKSNLSAFPKYTSYILQYFLNSF